MKKLTLIWSISSDVSKKKKTAQYWFKDWESLIKNMKNTRIPLLAQSTSKQISIKLKI